MFHSVRFERIFDEREANLNGIECTEHLVRMYIVHACERIFLSHETKSQQDKHSRTEPSRAERYYKFGCADHKM